MLMISVSEIFLVESVGFFLQNKICSFLAHVFVSTLAILLYETQLDQIP
jgi:hypothetical protein